MAVIWGLWTMRTPSGWRVRPSAADIDQKQMEAGTAEIAPPGAFHDACAHTHTQAEL